jgi:hypothetical protein
MDRLTDIKIGYFLFGFIAGLYVSMIIVVFG